MKKQISLLCALSLLASLVACGGDGGSGSDTTTSPTGTTEPAETTVSDAEKIRLHRSRRPRRARLRGPRVRHRLPELERLPHLLLFRRGDRRDGQRRLLQAHVICRGKAQHRHRSLQLRRRTRNGEIGQSDRYGGT